MRLDSLSTCTCTVEDLEFLYTSVRTHVHVVTMHAQMQDYNNDTHCECTTNYSFTYVSFVRNVAYVRFFSSSACEL